MKSFVKNSIISTRFFIKDNTITILFISLFTLGIVLGSLSLNFMGDNSPTLISILKSYFNENESLSILALFSRNLISGFIYLGAIYIAGLCAIGLPIVAIIPLIKGIAVGVIISYQYIFSGIKGFLYSAAIIIFPAALLVSVLNYAYCEGIFMSLAVSNGIFNGKPRDTKYSASFVTFTKRFLIFSVAVIIISIIEAVLSSLFSKVL